MSKSSFQYSLFSRVFEHRRSLLTGLCVLCFIFIAWASIWLNPIHFRRLNNRPKLLLRDDTSSKEKQHVVFAKVHKAAGTTVFNLMMRYAMKHELDVLLRKTYVHLNEGDSALPSEDLIPLPTGKQFYDILCHHLVFDYREISKYFPSDTVYLGIVREPFSHFRSAFVYYSEKYGPDYMLKAIWANRENPIEEFLRNPQLFLKDRKPLSLQINNRMSLDFGFPLDDFEESKKNKTKIDIFLNHLRSTFDFIMIAEMFDESLIMLRRLMNWSIKDILYIDSNVFTPSNTSLSWIQTKKYSSEVRRLFEKWAAIDVALYRYFYDIFQQRLDSQPDDFYDELNTFKEVRESVVEACQRDASSETTVLPMHFRSTPQSADFTLTSGDCHMMTSEAFVVTHKVRKLQLTRSGDHATVVEW